MAALIVNHSCECGQPTNRPSPVILDSHRNMGRRTSREDADTTTETSWLRKGYENLPQSFGLVSGWSQTCGPEVADEICKQGNLLRSRAHEMRRCGRLVAVRVCECGKGRPGSGNFRDVARTCGGRTCPYCSWKRAQERSELLRYAAETIPKYPDFKWQLLTQTLRYDNQKDSDDLSVEGIRSRALFCEKFGRELWKRHLRVNGAAMLRCTEISATGLVHVHAIYYGPEVDREIMSALSQKLDHRHRGGTATVEVIEGGAGRVARTARYASKSIKGHGAFFDEDFLEGQVTRKVIDPVLAARWEVAVHGLRLTQKYGSLYGLQAPHPDSIGRPLDDSNVECSCGIKGHWRTEFRSLASWLDETHWLGRAGLEHNRWTPYWLRERLRNKRRRTGGRRGSACRERRAGRPEW